MEKDWFVPQADDNLVNILTSLILWSYKELASIMTSWLTGNKTWYKWSLHREQ